MKTMLSAMLVCLWTVSALAGTPKAPTVEIKTAASGRIIYGGVDLSGPIVFGTDGKQLFIRCPEDSDFKASGFDWIPWQLQDPKRVVATTAQANNPIDSLMNRVAALAVSDQAAGYGGATVAELKKSAYLSSGLIDSVVIVSQHDLVLYFKGWSSPVHDLQNLDQLTPQRALPLVEKLRMRAAQLAEYLQQGQVIVIDYGTECIIPAQRVKAVKGDVSKLSFKDEEIANRFKQPRGSLRQVIEGGK
jgi:hypothetical protein